MTNKVTSVIRLLKSRKTLGADNSGNKVVKILPKKVICYLCSIIDAIKRL